MKCHLRVNTLKATVDQVTRELEDAGWRVAFSPWCVEAVTVDLCPDNPQQDRQRLIDSAACRQGHFILQNHSSLLPCLALQMEPELDVLDMCAAPGGKTTYLAALTGNQARILANDISRERIFRLRALAQQLGVTAVETECRPGHLLWQRYGDRFDRILLDAPCSMHGTSNPSTSEIRSLAKRQQFLLKSALGCARVGGIIVYSTCTIHSQENESVVAWLLERHPDEFEMLEIDLPGAPLQSAHSADHKGRTYPSDLTKCRRITADANTGMEGFFVAKLRKTASQQQGEPAKGRARSGPRRPRR